MTDQRPEQTGWGMLPDPFQNQMRSGLSADVLWYKNRSAVREHIERRAEDLKAAVMEAPGRLLVQEVPYPKPGPGEVTVKIKSCGLCGTDMHIFSGDYTANYPLIPGHETAGVVAELGPGVAGPAIGTRVAVDPHIYCGECYFCKTQRGNHCLNFQALGVTRNGGFAEYMVAPQKNLYPISDEMTFAEAAFVEPVSCVVYGLRRLKVSPGDHALIFGAGPIGLQLAQLVRHSGAASVTLTDLEPSRLVKARSLGFPGVVQAGPGQDEALRELQLYGFDLVIDATGVPTVAAQAFKYVKNTGKIMFFGVCPPDATIPVKPYDIYNRDLEIYGSFALCYTFYPARDLLENHALNVEALISHRITLEDLSQFLQPGQPKAGTMKVIVVFD